MNDALKMQISAFVDDELPESETELLLRRLSQDAALRRQVGEYLRIGRLIRGEREVRGMGDLRNRIAAALGEQPVDVPARPAESRNRFLKPVAGVAIAASVAALALVGLRQLDVADPARTTAGDFATPTAAMNSPGYTEPLPADALSGQPGEMLMQYYLSHGETTAGLGANGILTRLVTLEFREGELVEVQPGQARTATETPAGAPDTVEDKDKDNDNEDRDPE
jgi:sigma-E factor negative regulatory protein RseA